MYTAAIAFAWALGNKIVSELSDEGYLIVERDFCSGTYHCYLMDREFNSFFCKDHLDYDECNAFTTQQKAPLAAICWKPLFPANF